jgi:hypothetical protein
MGLIQINVFLGSQAILIKREFADPARGILNSHI